MYFTHMFDWTSRMLFLLIWKLNFRKLYDFFIICFKWIVWLLKAVEQSAGSPHILPFKICGARGMKSKGASLFRFSVYRICNRLWFALIFIRIKFHALGCYCACHNCIRIVVHMIAMVVLVIFFNPIHIPYVRLYGDLAYFLFYFSFSLICPVPRHFVFFRLALLMNNIVPT